MTKVISPDVARSLAQVDDIEWGRIKASIFADMGGPEGLNQAGAEAYGYAMAFSEDNPGRAAMLRVAGRLSAMAVEAAAL